MQQGAPVAEEAYYLDGSRNQQGPVPIAEIGRLIRGGTIRRDTLVWYPGMPDWRPASQVNELASFFSASAPPPRAPAGPPPLQASPAAAPMQRRAPIAGAYPGPGPGPQVQAARPSGSGGSMGFVGAIATCFRKYVDFTGRARRAEYWWFVLFYCLLVGALTAVDVTMMINAQIGGSLLSSLGSLALFLPTLAVAVRRLHDTDRTGWWILIGLIPLIGWIIYLVFMCQRGTEGPNRFGEDPLGPDVAATFE
jgi:uncharacterized membrane protein YhaH (DUF805 family)